MKIEQLPVPLAQLGESPVWHEEQQCLFWADLLTPSVYRYDPKTQHGQQWQMPARIGCIARRDEDSLWAAMGDGVYVITLSDMHAEQVASVIEPGFRMNDGRCDASGRFWFGSVAPDPHQPNGSFYCMDLDGSVHRVADDYHIPNGIGWSADNTEMYHCDSLGRVIYRYAYDLQSGVATNRDIIYREPSDSEPDGMAVDPQGRLWVAHWNGQRLDCLQADGQRIKSFPMPIQRPTSCAFNSDFSILYVTSCSQADLTEVALAPPAGAVFALDMSTVTVD